MKIYVLADMEGISGIRIAEQVKRDSPDFYAEGRELMMREVNAVVDELSSHGVSEIVVCDTHGGGGQLQLSRMDRRAIYELPNGTDMMPSLDESFDGLILLGHHARAGTLNGFLDHTFSGATIFELRMNGRVVGEIAVEAAFAGQYGVPVILVSGDEMAAREAKADLGEVECAIVKWAVGRNRAKCLSVENAHQVIREAVRRAIKNVGNFKPFKAGLPCIMEQTYYKTDMAESFAQKAGFVRVDGRTVRKEIESFKDLMRW